MRTCCSPYPTSYISGVVHQWFSDRKDLQITVQDLEEAPLELEPVATAALKAFGDRIFPLVYLGEHLIALGTLPGRADLLGIMENPQRECIHVEDVLKAAREKGLQTESVGNEQAESTR